LTTNRDTTTMSLVSSLPHASVYGASLTFIATVANFDQDTLTPDGMVTFYDDGTSMYAGTVHGDGVDGEGVLSWTTSALPQGSHAIMAVYSSGSVDNGNAALLTQTVGRDTTTTDVSSSTASSSAYGDSVTFTATVTNRDDGAVSPNGTVTFYDGITFV